MNGFAWTALGTKNARKEGGGRMRKGGLRRQREGRTGESQKARGVKYATCLASLTVEACDVVQHAGKQWGGKALSKTGTTRKMISF